LLRFPSLPLSLHSFLVGREGTCVDTNAEGERVPKAGEGLVHGHDTRLTAVQAP
jgi:hypothetical protein